MTQDAQPPPDPSTTTDLATSATPPTPAPGASDFTASFDVSVVYKGNTYTLNITPKTAGGVYGLQLEELPAGATTPDKIVEFAIVDEKNWAAGVNLPVGANGLALGSVTIKALDINFGEGTAAFPSAP